MISLTRSVSAEIESFVADFKKIQSNPEKGEEIGDKINKLIIPFFNTHLSETPETLYAIHKLAVEMISFSPLSQSSWKRLAPSVQALFHSLFPFSPPPTQKEEIALHTITSRLFRSRRSHIIRFADNFTFHLSLHYEGSTYLHFVLTDHPDFNFIATGSYPIYCHPEEQKFIKEMPLGIEDFFDAEATKKAMERDQKIPELSHFVVPQHAHQLIIMKRIYYCMIKESLGVPSSRPILASRKGIWTINRSTSIQDLSMAIPSASEEMLTAYAEQIARFLILEQRSGLYLMGHQDTDFNSLSMPLFLENRGLIYCPIPHHKFSYIEGSIGERHDSIQKYLRKTYPQLISKVEKIVNESAQEINVQIRVLSILKSTIQSGVLKIEDFLHGSEEALTILQVLKSMPAQFSEKSVPWTQIQNYGRLLSFLQLQREILRRPKRQQPNKETIFHCAKALVLNLPLKGKRNLPQDGFATFVNQDQAIRRDLRQTILRFLLQEFVKDPTRLLSVILEDLIESVNQELDKDPLLQQEPRPHHASWSDYYYYILWEELCDDLDKILTPEELKLDIFNRLLLLRVAHQVHLDKKEVEEKLQSTLHQHLKDYEKRRIGTQVAQVLATIKV